MPGEVDTGALAALVRRKVADRGNLREAAKQSGVSPATLSRVQRGHAPDVDALVALARWLQIPVETVLHRPPIVDTPREGSTPQKVEVHLRADRKLSPETASRLADIFKAVYEQFAEGEDAARGPRA